MGGVTTMLANVQERDGGGLPLPSTPFRGPASLPDIDGDGDSGDMPVRLLARSATDSGPGSGLGSFKGWKSAGRSSMRCSSASGVGRYSDSGQRLHVAFGAVEVAVVEKDPDLNAIPEESHGAAHSGRTPVLDEEASEALGEQWAVCWDLYFVMAIDCQI